MNNSMPFSLKLVLSVGLIASLCLGGSACTPPAHTHTHEEGHTHTHNGKTHSHSKHTHEEDHLPRHNAFVKKPKNIIFMVGDGMGLSQLTAALYSNNNALAIEQMPIIGLHKSYSADNLITDSAAGATAFSAGVKTYNGAIGVDTNKQAVTTIFELAEQQNMATGMVVTSTITHATPASFVAHQPQRKMYEEIAEDMLDAGLEVAIGGGKDFFTKRVDKRDLRTDLTALGYTISDDYRTISPDTDRFFVFTADDDPAKKMDGRDYLPQATQLAIDRLSREDNGFMLMVEGSQIDWGGHANDTEYIITEALDFDETIKVVLDFANQNGETLVVVTADHETGGFAINTGSNLNSIITATNKKRVGVLADKANKNLPYENDTIVGAFTSDYHTASLIPVYAYGPGSENFNGIYENTSIFNKFKKALGWLKK